MGADGKILNTDRDVTFTVTCYECSREIVRYSFGLSLRHERDCVKEDKHHLDGNKRNNRPENIVVIPNQSAHCRVFGFGHKLRTRREVPQ